MAWIASQAEADPTRRRIDGEVDFVPEGAINFNMGTFVGSYASVAHMLDEAATVPGTKGLMLTFDDFVVGMEQFGQRIQPLMKCRSACYLGHVLMENRHALVVDTRLIRATLATGMVEREAALEMVRTVRAIIGSRPVPTRPTMRPSLSPICANTM